MIGALACSPHRRQFFCRWREEGWAGYRPDRKTKEGGLVMGKRMVSRVFPSVDAVRPWHQGYKQDYWNEDRVQCDMREMELGGYDSEGFVGDDPSCEVEAYSVCAVRYGRPRRDDADTYCNR